MNQLRETKTEWKPLAPIENVMYSQGNSRVSETTWESSTKTSIVESSMLKARRRSLGQNISARKILLRGEDTSITSRKKEENQKWAISNLQLEASQKWNAKDLVMELQETI